MPYDKIVFQDKVVYHDKIVYHDKEVEVPIDRYVYVEPKLVPAQLLPRTITPVRYDYTDFSPNTSPRTSMTHQNGPTRMVNVPPVQLSSSGYIMPHSTTLNGSYKPVRPPTNASEGLLLALGMRLFMRRCMLTDDFCRYAMLASASFCVKMRRTRCS